MNGSERNPDPVRVARPCGVSWEDMCGTDRVRHCGRCNRRVYDLTNMTEEEGRSLVSETEGRACVRFFRRADGRLMTRDCGQAVRHGIVAKAAVLAGVSVLVAPIALTAREDVGYSPVMEPQANIRYQVQELERRLRETRQPLERNRLLNELKLTQAQLEALTQGDL